MATIWRLQGVDENYVIRPLDVSFSRRESAESAVADFAARKTSAIRADDVPPWVRTIIVVECIETERFRAELNKKDIP